MPRSTRSVCQTDHRLAHFLSDTAGEELILLTVHSVEQPGGREAGLGACGDPVAPTRVVQEARKLICPREDDCDLGHDAERQNRDDADEPARPPSSVVAEDA